MPDPKIKARFIEPMLLEPTEKLSEGAAWSLRIRTRRLPVGRSLD